MRFTKHVLLVTTLFAAALAPPALARPATPGAGGEDCPNERCCNVRVRFEYSGEKRRCGLGIRIFGVGGSIMGEVCWDHETKIPAHQENHGVYGAGSKCVKERDLTVQTRDCKCGGLMLPILETGFPFKCVCGEYKDSGTVEDFETLEC